MEKFKYGPLIWNCINEDDESGNYFWNGKPPVEYDRMNIPIDEEGMQCLPIGSPVHPTWQPDEKQFVFNDFLQSEIPSLKETKEWFDDNFLVISEKQCKKYIIKWIRTHRGTHPGYFKLTLGVTSMKEIMDRLWPQDEHK